MDLFGAPTTSQSPSSLLQLAQLLSNIQHKTQIPAAVSTQPQPQQPPAQSPNNSNSGSFSASDALNKLGNYIFGNPSDFVGPPTSTTWNLNSSLGSNIVDSALPQLFSLLGG